MNSLNQYGENSIWPLNFPQFFHFLLWFCIFLCFILFLSDLFAFHCGDCSCCCHFASVLTVCFYLFVYCFVSSCNYFFVFVATLYPCVLILHLFVIVLNFSVILHLFAVMSLTFQQETLPEQSWGLCLLGLLSSPSIILNWKENICHLVFLLQMCLPALNQCHVCFGFAY